MGKGMLFFNSGIGDTLLASGLIHKFSRHFNQEIYLAGEYGDILSHAQKSWDIPTYTSDIIHEVVCEGKGMKNQVEKHFDLGHLFYFYTNHSKQTDYLIKQALDELSQLGITDLYIMHYSYIFTELGRRARDYGMKVHGYFLDGVCKIMQSNRHHEPTPAVIWDNQYIGDRLSRLVTGLPLNPREDFTSFLDKPIRNKISLFPTTQSLAPNAGNWHMDLEVLRYLGFKTEIVYHYKENLPAELETKNLFFSSVTGQVLGGGVESIEQMLNHIRQSEFIICYDSASFHFAWLTGTPAIVKLKGGFNQEWIPTWVRNNPNCFFIPASPMHEEEYLTYLQAGIRQLGGEDR